MRTLFRFMLPAALIAVAACDDPTEVVYVDDEPGRPEELAVEYRWQFEGFTAAGQPVGHPAVQVTWLPPVSWDDEVFRIYARRLGASSFSLVATVTSCTVDGCTYLDRDVTEGVAYEYYVAATFENGSRETTTDYRDEIAVPAAAALAAPRADTAVALDRAAFVRWTDPQNGENIDRYRVFLTRVDGDAYLYPAGESDGMGYVDLRAENGHEYAYRVAAVDTLGRVSALSAEITAVPRPDFAGELVYAFGDHAAESGFRFSTSEDVLAVVPGDAAGAHWRLEADGDGWRIVPLNGTQVTEYPGRTTAIACGPAADAECRAARVAPAAGYTTAPVPVNPEFSYVFRVVGSDGQPHFGVIRVTLTGTDGTDRRLMVFDWAYQTRANEPRLNLGAGAGN